MSPPRRAGARDPLRFIVLQPGARMSYAVPALLARAGMLERFYTDICADVGPVRYLGPMWPERMRPRPVARLLGRRLPPEIPRAGCARFLSPAFANLALRRLPAGTRYLNGWTEPDHRLIELVRGDGFARANALYTVLINSDLDLVREARARGIRTVHEAMIGPDVGRWVQEEQALFPGIEETLPPSGCARATSAMPENMSFRISFSCHRSSSVVRSSSSAVIRSGSRPCPTASMRAGSIRSVNPCRDACCSSAP